MALHIVIGFDGPGASAAPSLVFLGESGESARKAMEKSDVFRFEIFRNPTGLRKHNPNGKLPADKKGKKQQ